MTDLPVMRGVSCMLPTGDCGGHIVWICARASDEDVSPLGGEPTCGGESFSIDWKVPLNRDFCPTCIAGGDFECVIPRGADFSITFRRPFISGEGLINSTIM